MNETNFGKLSVDNRDNEEKLVDHINLMYDNLKRQSDVFRDQEHVVENQINCTLLELQPKEQYHQIFEKKVKVWQENLVRQIDI